ncbi:putative small heat shock protein [Methanosarcina sp. MTP4]|uniref:Hsp20/alpha crystallin family protein n=1 Tax=Methanosarcina sp. MTP4 TaxID=1434100 RepID=UPI00061543F0|nr:heat-shock protein [Methanosarcina sp. MTP4]AKB23871.1 putative small heat shock protein [Methanosarcina sp. MTP4]
MKIEVILPGIEKENISFKLGEDGFYVKATKKGVEYVDSYSICFPVNTDKAATTYSSRILKVTVPYQEPFENAVDVKIE